MKILNIGKDFCDYTGGRYYSDGEGSGEDFRENYLMKVIQGLQEGGKIKIILDDGVEGYGSSFLSEGFAGCVKHGYIKSDDLLRILIFEYSDREFEFYKNRIIDYIKNSDFNSEYYVDSKK